MRLRIAITIAVMLFLLSACSEGVTPEATITPAPTSMQAESPSSSIGFSTLDPSSGGMFGSNESAAKTDAQSAYNMLSTELISNGESVENGTLIIVQKGRYYEFTCNDGALTLTNTYESEPNTDDLSREVDGETVHFEKYELNGLAEHILIFVKK